MTLLLDTHVVLWWMAGERARIGKKAVSMLKEPGERIVISAVTGLGGCDQAKAGKARCTAKPAPVAGTGGMELLSVTARHADRVGALPMHHRDPFDRLLIAQAEVENFALVTGDGGIGDYEVEVVW